MSDIGPVTAASKLSALDVEGARPAVDKGRDPVGYRDQPLRQKRTSRTLWRRCPMLRP